MSEYTSRVNAEMMAAQQEARRDTMDKADKHQKQAHISTITKLMTEHVKRAVRSHIIKHERYEVGCYDQNQSSKYLRSFTALDNDVAADYGVEVVGVMYDTYYTLIIITTGDLKQQLPPTIQRGYWDIFIDDGNEVLSYSKHSELKGWDEIACSSLDYSCTMQELETAVEVMQSHTTFIAMTYSDDYQLDVS